MPVTPPSESNSPPEPDRAEPPEPPSSAKDGDDIPSVGSVLNFGEAGAYTLEERLGRGGMGVVYRARQVGAKGFSQHVAIKRLRPDHLPWEARSFIVEARVLSRLHHENIARVYAFLELNGSHYLVMEYIAGQSLYALLELARRKGYRFPEPVACEVMAEVADALSYAHHATDEAGKPLQIIHRDVSPSNILITDSGRAVLVDFGVALANMDGRTSTRSGFIKGKTPYLSPEQVKELPLDGRSDLFSVGTILVEMLTGRAPFGSTRSWNTMYRIGAVTPEHVAALLPDVSPPLRAICQKLLASDPEQRFADGNEVRQALRQHAGLYDGPPAVQAEVAKLRALPDVQPRPARAELPALREVKRARHVATLVGALAFACLFVSWYVASRYLAVPSSTPQKESTMSQTKSPEQPVTPQAWVPSPPAAVEPKEEAERAVASAVPPASRTPTGRVFPSRSCGAAIKLASVLAIVACHPRVPTGTKAGDCSFTPARDANGIPIPKAIVVEFISLNGKKCTGQNPTYSEDIMHFEPCPAEDGEIVARVIPATGYPFVKEFTWDTAPFLYGTAHVIPVKGGEKASSAIHGANPEAPHRDTVARMTALFTEMRMDDGTRVPICGVLFDAPWRVKSPKLKGEGIPVLDPKYYGTLSTPTWTTDEYVRMYYPPP